MHTVHTRLWRWIFDQSPEDSRFQNVAGGAFRSQLRGPGCQLCGAVPTAAHIACDVRIFDALHWALGCPSSLVSAGRRPLSRGISRKAQQTATVVQLPIMRAARLLCVQRGALHRHYRAYVLFYPDARVHNNSKISRSSQRPVLGRSVFCS